MGSCSSISSSSTASHSVAGSSTAEYLHVKCRHGNFGGMVVRLEIPDDRVSWSVPWPDYNPPFYTDASLLASLSPGSPDPEIGGPIARFAFNVVDGAIDRRSLMGRYTVEDGYPINPMGRTGLRGRGTLFRWGPNHAADPIVTRWKRQANDEADVKASDQDDESDSSKVIHPESQLPILEFVAIQREDTKEWALPGGFVQLDEIVTSTLSRRFYQEAVKMSKQEEEDHDIDDEYRIRSQIVIFFSRGKEVYRGYVDDPRNTDNAWIETVAYSFHDGTGKDVGKLALTP
ncbi:unnamed protein product, partial [Cyprideis torosa]